MPKYTAQYEFNYMQTRAIRHVFIEAAGILKAQRLARKTVLAQFGGPVSAYKLKSLVPRVMDEFAHIRYLNNL